MEHADTDIIEISAALDAGEISASRLLMKQLANIELRQALLNCYVEMDIAGAQRLAETSDRRRLAGGALSLLDGIPVALKDNVDVAGLTTRNGTKYSHSVSDDAAVSAILREAGAIILGS